MKLSLPNHINYGLLLEAAFYPLSEPGRFYHNVEHTLEVNKACRDILNDDGIEDSLWLASIWHDVIYVPGSTTNEAASAEHLAWSLNRLGLLQVGQGNLGGELGRAQALIRCTQICNHVHPAYVNDDPLSYVLLDADLVGLAHPEYEVFERRQINILLENGLKNTWINRTASSKFLKQFTDRPYIYHTEYGQKHWEAQARKNINEWAYEKDF